MNSSCELQAVVVSADPCVVSAMSECLGELGINAMVQARSSAIDLLAKHKIDAFFVDQELDPEFSVIEHARRSSSSRAAVTFAIVPRPDGARSGLRVADFLTDKPILREHLRRSLRASYGIMLKERRRYTRYALSCEATLQDSTARKFPASTTNLSQTGLALECAAPLIEGEEVVVQFRLPHSQDLSKFKAQVIWTAANAKVGVAFTRMSSVDRERLTEWIDGEFLRQWHPFIPEEVAARFMHAAR